MAGREGAERRELREAVAVGDVGERVAVGVDAVGPQAGRALASLLALGIWGGAIAAIMVVPAAELLQASIRAGFDGSAVNQAATAVMERAIELAARILEASAEDLDLTDGAVSVRGDPGARLTLADIARAAGPASGYLREGEPAGLSARLDGAGGARFCGALRRLGDRGTDPTVLLERGRRVAPMRAQACMAATQAFSCALSGRR